MTNDDISDKMEFTVIVWFFITGWLLFSEHDDRHVHQGSEGLQGRRLCPQADHDVRSATHHGQVRASCFDVYTLYFETSQHNIDVPHLNSGLK
jgi:hypothetical protein